MKRVIPFFVLLIAITSCASMGEEPFQETVGYVDMERFSGDWYVIALLPTAVEKNVANGIENYSLTEEGNIIVRYTFRKGSPGGKEKVMYQKGWVYDRATNADWRVQPLWPLKLPYYILELSDDYSYTVIGTNNFKYLWIMSREPQMENELLDLIFDRMARRGYEKEDILFMEQSWGRE